MPYTKCNKTKKIGGNRKKNGGAVKTRAMRRKTAVKAKNRSTAKRSYRKRVAASKCRRVTRSAVCKRTSGCKVAKGKKRTFCRKSRNTHRK